MYKRKGRNSNLPILVLLRNILLFQRTLYRSETLLDNGGHQAQSPSSRDKLLSVRCIYQFFDCLRLILIPPWVVSVLSENNFVNFR